MEYRARNLGGRPEFWAGALCACLLFRPLCAASEDKRDSPKYLALEAGSQVSYWNPGLKTDRSLVQYRAEGLASYKAQTVLSYGEAILALSYEAPFRATSQQKEMLLAHKSQVANLERYTLRLNARPFLLECFPFLKEHYLSRALLSAEFYHSEAVFYGNAQVLAPFMFLPSGARVDWQKRTVAGAQKMEAGTSLAFRTQFVENEITVSLWDFTQYSFRMGYYNLAWQRPSDNDSNYAISDGRSVYPILFETTYETSGFVVFIKNKNPAEPGWNGEFSYWGGLHNRIVTALGQPQEDNRTVHFDGFRLGIWYNWDWAEKSSRGFYLGLGANGEWRNWSIETKNNNPALPSSTTYDFERLFGICGRMGYKF